MLKIAQKKSKFAELAQEAKKGSNLDSYPEISEDEEQNEARRGLFKQQKSRTIELENYSPQKPELFRIDEKVPENKITSKFEFTNTDTKQAKP